MSLFNRFRRGKTSIPARFTAARITAPVIAGLIASLAFFIGPATAQIKGIKDQQQSLIVEGIDFGSNTSAWANDGECDDTRFIGIGTAVDMVEGDTGRDAQDCSTLFLAGDIILKPDPADIVDDINFGSNTSDWADNDICDDPRFGGSGTDELLLDEDIGRDANDCKSLFLAGQVQYLGDDPNMEIIDFDGILFGDNTSQWANDEECDDPRFAGTGMATELVDDDLEHDATDCVTLYQAGSISLVKSTETTAVASVDFGDDSSEWANDGECDDPRFAGEGTASLLLDEDLARDATDCLTLYQSGQIYLAADYQPQDQTVSTGLNSASIDFGDDSNQYANDGECDDPRFAGPGVASVLLDEDLGRDATDCRQLFESGEIYLIASTDSTPAQQDTYFGNNTSRWANDGECDDPRFMGIGMASQLDATDLGRDATDCKNLVDEGKVEIITGANVDYGDDSSEWANDGECDDPRFAGPGSAIKLDPRNFGRDASDCQMLVQSGQIDYVGGVLGIIDPASVQYDAAPDQGNVENNPSDSAGSSGIVWGNDSSRWANDGECDDPRFAGPGAADNMDVADRERDATDCRTLFEAGQLELAESSSLKSISSIKAVHANSFDFGDDSSDYANNGICDDQRFGGPGTDPVLLTEDIGRDATDCRALFASAEISFVGDLVVSFGDDSSEWANDDECDDPRFGGKAMADVLLDEDMFKDATDCRTAFERGKVFFVADGQLDFGENTSEWANDNECDDLRFAGPGAAGSSTEENLFKDAADCSSLYRTGQLYLLPVDTTLAAIAYGDNSSEWANDGECDDPRFFGLGSAEILLDDDLGHDAVDCRMLFEIGQIEFGTEIVATGKPKAGSSSPAPSTSAIDFGDDSSSWANDGECDDPRFAGPGVASTLLDDDLGRDATDCSALFQQGQIRLVQGSGQLETDQPAVETTTLPSTSTEGELNFGDDTSVWANDGECDDPRFAGPGSAPSPLSPLNLLKDATDCQTLFENGNITLI